MKISFVSGNREKLPDAVIPLGLLYVMASTPNHHERTLLDLCFEEDPKEALAAHLRIQKPDVVALGMRNVQSADYTGVRDCLAYYRDLIATIRASTRAPLVIGGSGFSVMPRELMGHLRPDYGISGEGERAFPDLLHAIESDGGFERVGNLHWFRDGSLLSNLPPPAFLDLDAVPAPDRSLVEDRYYQDYGIESVQTKRGCPLRCDYCTYPVIEGRVGRVRDPGHVVDELVALRQERPLTRHVFIVDSVFNLPQSHAKAVCRAMVERSVDLPWTCYANPLGFDQELAELMASAGCAGMEVGSDSGSGDVLERLRKGFTTRHIRDLHELAKAAGLPDCHTFILGTPGEELDDVRRTLEFIVELDPFSVIIMIWTDDAEAVHPELRLQRRRLRESIMGILEDHKHEFPWWSIPEIGFNHDAALFEKLRQSGLHGPLWQHIRALIAERPYRRRRSVAHSPRRKKGAWPMA